MRRRDRELTREDASAILADGVYGVLSMNGRGSTDYAYGVPVGYVYTGDSIYIHCALEGQKLDHIRENNRVSFCVVTEANVLAEQFAMEYASAIAFGRAHEASEEEKIEALAAFIKKYSPDFREKGREYLAKASKNTYVIRIDIEHITGKTRRA